PYTGGRDAGHVPSPTCDHVYTRSSARSPGQAVTARWLIRWRVAWVGGTTAGGASGSLDDLTSATAARLVVAEAQALVTS
ncbi:MAG TPA: hypothetical protein VEL73_09150, partial [Mycobacteriales bacterium]|nr:hypothetical protein [Mycobacteriales bacterium]